MCSSHLSLLHFRYFISTVNSLRVDYFLAARCRKSHSLMANTSSSSPPHDGRPPRPHSSVRELTEVAHAHRDALLRLRRAECVAQRHSLATASSLTKRDAEDSIRRRHQEVDQERKTAEQYLQKMRQWREEKARNIVEQEQQQRRATRRVFSAVYEHRVKAADDVRTALSKLRDQAKGDKSELLALTREEHDQSLKLHRARQNDAISELERQRNAARQARTKEKEEVVASVAGRRQEQEAHAELVKQQRQEVRQAIARARQEVEERNAKAKAQMVSNLRKIRESEIAELERLTSAFQRLS